MHDSPKAMADRRHFSIDVRDSFSDPWSIEHLVAVVHRRRTWIFGSLGAALLAALLYILIAIPQYTATVDLFIDTAKVRAVADTYDISSVGFESAGIDSQVEIIKSERIALALLRKLDLKNNPRFTPSPYSPREMVRNFTTTLGGWLGLGGADTLTRDADTRLERTIVEWMSSNFDVKRVGRTYVLELTFTTDDPEFAATIANAYAEQYLVDQLDAKYESNARAANWLRDRISELRERSMDADKKVQEFRTRNGLFTVDGKSVEEQQLRGINDQLTDARARMADTEAKAKRIDSIISSGNTDAAVNESLVNPVIANVRTKYLDAVKREADISAKLGRSHIAAVNLRADIGQYERLMFDELGRIAESYRSDFQIAKNRVENLEKSLGKTIKETSSSNQNQVALRDLERESETFRTMYQLFLQRYQEAVQQQSFPITDARVITAATPPLRASWPRKPLVLLGSLLAGLLVGGTGVAVKEFRDRVFRTGTQIQDILGLLYLGHLRNIPAGLPPASDEVPAPGRIASLPDIYRQAKIAPLSGFTETLRSSKVSADITLKDVASRVLGVISVLPGEGKTVFSKNFASLLAMMGKKTLLIDCDLRNPGLSRVIAPACERGLIEFLDGKYPFTEVLWRETETGLDVLPISVDHGILNSSELLTSRPMRNMIDKVSEYYDYIVLDMPPVGPVVDARAAAEIVDGFIVVVEWGKTSRQLVAEMLANEPDIKSRCIGAVLNRVDEAAMEDYGSSDYRNHGSSKYRNYYTN